MKNLSVLGGGMIIFGLIVAFTPISRSFNKVEILSFLEPRPVELIDIEIEAPDILEDYRSHDAFLEAIGFRESGNSYTAVNRFGYMGRYQFGMKTLRALGYEGTRDEFLVSPHIQEHAMRELLLHNQNKLRKLIEEYDGEIVHGIEITESGILAAAHLAGVSNVKKFFNKGKEFRDGFGTSMTSYMVKFSGYNLDL